VTVRGSFPAQLAELRRAVDGLRGDVSELEKTTEGHGNAITKLIEQISGERGLNATVEALANRLDARLDALTKVAWTITVVLITALLGLIANAAILLTSG
jgi:hypothetical protein